MKGSLKGDFLSRISNSFSEHRYTCYAMNNLGTNQGSVDLSTDAEELLQYDVEILSQANHGLDGESKL